MIAQIITHTETDTATAVALMFWMKVWVSCLKEAILKLNRAANKILRVFIVDSCVLMD